MKRAEKSTVEQSGDLRGSLQAAACDMFYRMWNDVFCVKIHSCEMGL